MILALLIDHMISMWLSHDSQHLHMLYIPTRRIQVGLSDYLILNQSSCTHHSPTELSRLLQEATTWSSLVSREVCIPWAVQSRDSLVVLQSASAVVEVGRELVTCCNQMLLAFQEKGEKQFPSSLTCSVDHTTHMLMLKKMAVCMCGG